MVEFPVSRHFIFEVIPMENVKSLEASPPQRD